MKTGLISFPFPYFWCCFHQAMRLFFLLSLPIRKKMYSLSRSRHWYFVFHPLSQSFFYEAGIFTVRFPSLEESEKSMYSFPHQHHPRTQNLLRKGRQKLLRTNSWSMWTLSRITESDITSSTTNSFSSTLELVVHSFQCAFVYLCAGHFVLGDTARDSVKSFVKI